MVGDTTKKTTVFSLKGIGAGLSLISGAYGGDLLLNGESTSNGMNIAVYAPEGFTDRVEIYTCSNLVSGNWRVAVENLRPAGGSSVQWHSGTSNSGFFIAGNMDVDSDGDGLSDAREKYVYKTDPYMWDSDGDWLPDGWELANSLDALTPSRTVDSDHDGLDNGTEYLLGTNPFSADSDGDGMPDLWEVNSGTDPRINDAAEDPDGDGLTNYQEYIAGTDTQKADTDEDGIPDGFEVNHGMNPRDPQDAWGDLDGDLIPNFYEYIHNGSDPANPMAVPVPTAVVSTNGHDGTFTNLQDAVDAVATNEYPIVFIEPGNYSIAGTTGIVLTNADILIYAAPNSVVLDGNGSNRVFNMVSGQPILAGLVLQNGCSDESGGAVLVSHAKTLIRSCIFLNNRANGSGGAVYSAGDTLEMVNCVFMRNEASNGGAVGCCSTGPKLINCTWVDNQALGQGGAIYNGSIINGIVWSNRADVSDSQIYGAEVSYSCVDGGYTGLANTANDPHLMCGWHLATTESSCLNSGSVMGAAKFDLDGEERDSLPDIGADEWVDRDADGLPDWWEKKWFGNLNAITDADSSADDSDGRLSYRQKYLYGLNPYSADSDTDGLSDYAEIYIYKTNPLAADNARDVSTGYSIEQTGYEWIDISKTGQVITNFYQWVDFAGTGQASKISDMDNGFAEIPIGFQFPFSDKVYGTAYVCNNGFVSFRDDSPQCANEPLPARLLFEKTLCVFWDDLRMDNDARAAVYVQPGPDQCVISFEKIPFYNRYFTTRLSFQVILKADGRIFYQYKDVASDGTLPTVGTQWGAGAVEFYAGDITNGTALSIHDNDADHDGVGDDWEMKWFGGLGVITNGADFVAGSRLFTYAESAHLGLNPTVTDTDGDGLSDKYEIESGRDPLIQQDSDNDGMPDHFETAHGLNPADASDALADPDGDGFPNLYEYKHGTDLFDAASVPAPNRYVSLAGQHIAPFTNSATAATNLQSALAAAKSYDIILVANGTYTGPENRDLKFQEKQIIPAALFPDGEECRRRDAQGKPLMLLSEGGSGCCVLDCENNGRGLSVENVVTGGSVVRGIQFLRGYSDWSVIGDYDWSWDVGYGGAAYCNNARVLFENCRFSSNTVPYHEGGAVYGLSSSVIFKNCIFTNNGEEGNYGGACFFDLSTVEMLGCAVTGTKTYTSVEFCDAEFLIENCVLSNNLGGALCASDNKGRIKNSIFSDNRDDYDGGVCSYSADMLISSCVFLNNSGTYGSGALSCNTASLEVENCLFRGNSSDNGAIYFDGGSSIRLQNCTVFSNRCPALYREYSWSPADIVARNTILWGNESGSYNEAAGSDIDIEFSCLPERSGTNNIYINPKLVPETGALLPVSPCIDHGSDSSAPAADMAGTPRWDHPWLNNGVDTSIADIGAFEFADSDTDADGLGDLWEIYYFTNITFSSGADDYDGDGLSTFEEYRLNTNPVLIDSDSDGLTDAAEITLYGTDPLCADSDGDGLSDDDEINLYGTDPLNKDTDGDSLCDKDEITIYHTDPLNPNDDSDGDGLVDGKEINLYGTDPLCADSDGDGLSDGDEINLYGTNPLCSDSDGDTLNDGDEVHVYHSDPLKTDGDSDGMPDVWEVAHGLNPLIDDASGDPDSDGLINLLEYRCGSDPHNPDTDGDGLTDGFEQSNGTNPVMADSNGDGLNDNVDPTPWALDSDGDGDGMPYGWEVAHGLDFRVNDAGIDADQDGLTNLQEYQNNMDPHLSDTDGDGLTDWYEIYQKQSWADICASLSSPGGLWGDADDNGQMNLYELRRVPKLQAIVQEKAWRPGYLYPPVFLFKGEFISDDYWAYQGPQMTSFLFAKIYYAEPGNAYKIGDLLSFSAAPNTWLQCESAWPVSHISWLGGQPDVWGTIYYPYSCDYGIARGASGTFGRRMKLFLNNDDDDGDGLPDCNNESIVSPAETNDMGLVIFKRMIIHPDAPTPKIYLSASSELRLFRASTLEPIKVHRHGEPWSADTEDISAELRAGDLAVLVKGILPSSPPEQATVEDSAFWVDDLWQPDVLLQAKWGTYVGLYCKDDADRCPFLENDMLRFSVEVQPKIKLIPDWNRDRKIDLADEKESANSLPFRFWINDDSDDGDIAKDNSDVPGQGGRWGSRANYEDNTVNGRSDLTDLFPVWLNIGSALAYHPPGNGVVYRLSQAQGALKFVYTALEKNAAGDYLITDVSSCGPNSNQNVRVAATEQITAQGITLDSGFLGQIAGNPDKGVLLMEANRESTAPLVLEVLSNNTVLARTELPLSLDGVEKMFRHKNLRAEIGVGGKGKVLDRDTTPNWPDSLCSTANLFFLHGANVDEQSARGWHAEIFKRLYWSGSKAHFNAVTWCGDKGADANYQENVDNAFKTAPYLKGYVSLFSGAKIMLAHSLGNMVVSSAIQDYDMSVQKYLMLDAAVASEAFDASLFNAATNNNPMLPEDWAEYNSRTWSANFYNLYSYPDKRSQMTWRGRFASVVSNAYNFYSSEDEVFELYPSVAFLSGFDLNLTLGRYVWQKQEVFKGCDSALLPGSVGSTKWWGWGFHSLLESAGYANGLNTNELRKSPVFRHNPDWYIHVDNLTPEAVNEMLAMGVPALSPSAGQTNLACFNPLGQPPRNTNISELKDSVNGWPRNSEPYPQRWLHSDCKNMAYLYTYRLFEELTAKGGLK